MIHLFLSYFFFAYFFLHPYLVYTNDKTNLHLNNKVQVSLTFSIWLSEEKKTERREKKLSKIALRYFVTSIKIYATFQNIDAAHSEPPQPLSCVVNTHLNGSEYSVGLGFAITIQFGSFT